MNMSGMLRFGLGLANVPDDKIADLDNALPGLSRMALAGRTLPVARANPRLVPREHLRPTREGQMTGIITQNRDFRVERLVDTIHFVDKHSAPLLQIADACAFGMRRWLAGQSSGLEFAKSVVENYPLVAEDWAGGMSCGLYYWHQQKKVTPKRGIITWVFDALKGRS
jgi:Protein of unknown function (DUF3800)